MNTVCYTSWDYHLDISVMQVSLVATTGVSPNDVGLKLFLLFVVVVVVDCLFVCLFGPTYPKGVKFNDGM